ncbi:alpha/beta fold hydrolase [Caulobacter sp. NIBR2454]|uniref:alpha/beta fold hydrolase n=1 Tax=Caulobacter sp. NIBR2454 TaxID=3015996 RepID=UPI0022B6FA1D|nr:alpha/beta hydrolase [Caulobacter sp. NIBR2454]
MRPVVMIHGAFCGGWVFDDFRRPFEAVGFDMLTPDLPGHGPDENPAGQSMSDYARAIADVCEAQSEPAILIGHSLGGLVAQMAAARLATRRRPVAALILLAPSSPWGVTGTSMEEAVSAFGLYGLGPYWLQSVDPQYDVALNYSLNNLTRVRADEIFARMVPESGRALFETLNWWLDPMMTTSVSAIGVPTLTIAGGRDVIHPPATVRQTAARLGGAFRTFPQMSHWLPAEPGWDDVAAACLEWLTQEARAAA